MYNADVLLRLKNLNLLGSGLIRNKVLFPLFFPHDPPFVENNGGGS